MRSPVTLQLLLIRYEALFEMLKRKTANLTGALCKMVRIFPIFTFSLEFQKELSDLKMKLQSYRGTHNTI